MWSKEEKEIRDFLESWPSSTNSTNNSNDDQQEILNNNDQTESVEPSALVLTQRNSNNAFAFYKLKLEDVKNEGFQWIYSILEEKKCPYSLTVTIAKLLSQKISDEMSQRHQNGESVNDLLSPTVRSDDLYKEVTTKLDELCMSAKSDPEELIKLSQEHSSPSFLSSVAAVKNGRRKMEDRHVILHNLNSLFGIKSNKQYSYYAVFDGHAGVDAATYTASHLHLHLINSDSFKEGDIKSAIKEAFSRTDLYYLERSAREGFKSGSTAVCCLFEGREKLFVARLGDSQAILVKNGKPLGVNSPRKPECDDERNRIEEKAIGDPKCEPYVSTDSDIEDIELDGTEDFLIVACDGLWDQITPEEATGIVYLHLAENCNTDTNRTEIAQKVSNVLIESAKRECSTDNITVIVVFLRDIEQILKTPFTPPSPKTVTEDQAATFGTDLVDEVVEPPMPIEKLVSEAEMNPAKEPVAPQVVADSEETEHSATKSCGADPVTATVMSLDDREKTTDTLASNVGENNVTADLGEDEALLQNYKQIKEPSANDESINVMPSSLITELSTERSTDEVSLIKDDVITEESMPVEEIKEDLDGSEPEIEGEREQGDGQESDEISGGTNEELDDDEDRRNPQYIPKRGAFYEHDDRVIIIGNGDGSDEVNAGIEESEKVPCEPPIVIAKKEEVPEKPLKKGKKLWSDAGKWGHDLFNEDEQKPKSREEVIMTYGYDIRKEDGPPKARRRQKYGRGPNKYTRNWQDEDAYDKPKAKDKDKGRERSKSRPRSVERSSQKSREDFERDLGPKDYHNRRPKHSNAFSGDEFPELTPKDHDSRRKTYEKRPAHDDTVANAWNRSRPRPEKDFPALPARRRSPEVEYKTEHMKVIEALEKKGKSEVQTSQQSVESRVEMVRTQTFENSKYTNRRSGPNEDSYNGKSRGKPKPFNQAPHLEVGRAIRKTNQAYGEQSPQNYGGHPKQELGDKRGKNVVKMRDEHHHHHHYEDNQCSNKHREHDPRSYGSNYGSNYQSEINSGIQKPSVDKINRNAETDISQQRPKRYSSLRQQQQQRAVTDTVPSSGGAQFTGAALPVPPLNHPQQEPPLPPPHDPSQSQYFEGAPGSPGGYYNESQSPPASFAYIPPQANPDNPASAPPSVHPAPYLPQGISSRYLPQAPAGHAPDPQFMPPNAPQGAPPHPVLSGPATSFLPPGYPPGYPQFPPPPPTPQFHPLAPPPPPAPPSSQGPEIYRGGVTYYDTTSQQGPRQLPQRRPKNAIPIIPPDMMGQEHKNV